MGDTRQGPRLRIVASCDGCSHLEVTMYRVQGAVGRDVDCMHPDGKHYIGAFLHDSTPQWCPLLRLALDEFTRGNPQHKVNQ